MADEADLEVELERSPSLKKLQEELSEMRTSTLRKKAQTVGIDEAGMEMIDDSDDPKAAAIQAILTETSPRKEIESLKMSALRKRAAQTAGVDEAALEQIDDADDPRTAAIEMIVDVEVRRKLDPDQAAAGSPRGHGFGSRTSSKKVDAAQPAVVDSPSRKIKVLSGAALKKAL
eukprot:COSAG04_NODE_8919_length_917_cov_1.289731_2_plen_173_part_01